MSAIHDLFFDDLDPQKQDYPPSYRKAMEGADEEEDFLTDELSGDCLHHFLAYANHHAVILGHASAESFARGFRLGARLVMDAVAD